MSYSPLPKAHRNRMVLTIDIQSQLRRLLHGECTLASLAQPVESENEPKPDSEPTFKSAGFKSSFKRIDAAKPTNIPSATGPSTTGSMERSGEDRNVEPEEDLDGEPVEDLDGGPVEDVDEEVMVDSGQREDASMEEDMDGEDMDGVAMEDVDGDPLDGDVDGEPL